MPLFFGAGVFRPLVEGRDGYIAERQGPGLLACENVLRWSDRLMPPLTLMEAAAAIFMNHSDTS